MARNAFAAVVALFCLTGVAFAQLDLNLQQPLSLNKDAGKKPEKVVPSLVANVQAVQPGVPFEIGIHFSVPKNYYAYYKNAGTIGLPSKLNISGPEGFEIGPLQWPGPDVKHQTLGKKQETNFIYKRDVVVFAEVTPPKNLEAGSEVEFTATTRFQYCEESGGCFLSNEKLSLKLPVAAGNAQVEPSEFASKFTSARRNLPVHGSVSKYAKVSGKLNVDKLYPGAKAQLQVAIDIEDGFHIQTHEPGMPGLISTELIPDLPEGIKQAGPAEYPQPQPPTKSLPGMEGVMEYRGTAVITLPIEVRENFEAESVTIGGLVRYQACNDQGSCFPPIYASFETTVPVTKDPGEVSQTPPIVQGNDSTPDGSVSGSVLDQVTYDDADQSFGIYLLYAFLGGLILNVMPCVLPVIAIKVLSFVQQAGESRGRIFLLNVAYSFGILTVFMVLASLAVGPQKIGWGGLFQKEEFNLVMAGLVFAMGLSLLGVFEIPVPGFIGSAAAGAHREGYFGAYLTGIFATLLATPCSGPFLGVTLGWSVRQEPSIAYATWAMMALGMSSPYLLIGAFPAMVRILPKPGNWMVTFKELAGLVLMATVVWIIYFLNPIYTMPALVMLVGLAIGFYMVGNLYDINSHIKHKTTVWITAIVLTSGIGLFAFTVVKDVSISRKQYEVAQIRQELVEEIDKKLAGQLEEPLSVMLAKLEAGKTPEADSSELPWQPFSVARLEQLLAEGKTVLVDFSAYWCLTCKTNEAVALNTKATRQLVDELGVVTLYADYSYESPEIKAVLEKFGAISVPLTVIFPGTRPTEPIILRDAFTQSTLLEALRKAGPGVSKPDPQAVSQSP